MLRRRDPGHTSKDAAVLIHIVESCHKRHAEQCPQTPAYLIEIRRSHNKVDTIARPFMGYISKHISKLRVCLIESSYIR